LAAAAHQLMESQARRVTALLDESGQRLHPLGEPLTTDFGVHRWLAGNREEAYSDWLQWVLLQLHTPGDVFRLLSTPEPASMTGWRGGPPTVSRELPVPQGHEGRSGRLDLIIRYEGLALLVVEVKRTDADEADTVKQRGYKLWLDDQPEPQPHKFPILLATDADEDLYEGFRFLSWAEVCLGMRQLARRLCGQGKGVVAAMTLAFVGAVEQNLLGFSAPRAGGPRTAVVNPRLADHLERWLSGETQ
jgi:hypothetical protein